MKKDFGFTLAEVLITLAIIGVVAAMTIPTLVANYQEKSWNTAASVFNRKLGEALKVMNAQSALAGFATTRDFVDELSKHIKIIKTCNSNELDICFASEFSTNEKTYKIEELKQAKNLNKDGNYGTETIGVVFVDGVTALIAYNPNATQDPFSNQVVGVNSSGKGKDLSIGLGTDALAILYDVTGFGNPNIYGTGDSGKLKDIRGINVSIKTGADILILGTNYSPVDCSDSTAEGYEYCNANDISKGYTSNYWVGAKKACAEQGMKLPTMAELTALYHDETCTEKPTDGDFWTSTEDTTRVPGASAYVIAFWSGGNNVGTRDTQKDVLCIAN